MNATRGGSERHVFVEVFLRRGGGRLRGATGAGRVSAGFPTLATAGCGAVAAAAAEELEIVTDHFHATALFLGGLVLPLVEAQAAFDEKRAALGAILGDVLAGLAPGLDV